MYKAMEKAIVKSRKAVTPILTRNGSSINTIIAGG